MSTGENSRVGSASANHAHAGRDINVTNIYHRYAQSPLSSQICIRQFKTLVIERTRDFVGRDFVFRSIDRSLNLPDRSSGYIVIRGEPGIGKTALMAQLVKTRDYVHHFNISTQNIRSHRVFLANVCSQLIVRYDLEHNSLPPDATEDSGHLVKLLDEVAGKTNSKPVVVLVDALDEAQDIGLPAEANRLFLPSSLPEGVFFVITTREEHDSRLAADRIEEIYLRDGDPLNYADIQRYVTNFVRSSRQAMAACFEAWNVAEDEFVQIVTEKSQGNFMYLVYVLPEIREGKLGKEFLANIRDLPAGLLAYYQRHWRIMRDIDTDRFEKYYEPVVCTLAVVREPVTLAQPKSSFKLAKVKLRGCRKGSVYTWRPVRLNQRGRSAERMTF